MACGWPYKIVLDLREVNIDEAKKDFLGFTIVDLSSQVIFNSQATFEIVKNEMREYGVLVFYWFQRQWIGF